MLHGEKNLKFSDLQIANSEEPLYVFAKVYKINALFVLHIFDNFHSCRICFKLITNSQNDVNKRESRYTIKGVFLVSS